MDVSKIFSKKNWKDRVVEFPGRRRIRDVATGEEKVIDVSRNEGTILQEGDLYNALNMNDLERRAGEAFAALGEYVADGKTLIASAITNKGVPTASDEKFSVMAENIGKMSSIKPGLLGQNQLRNTAVGSNITLNLSFSSGTYQYVAVCLTNAHFRENGNASLYWNNSIGTRLIEHRISSGGDFYQCDTIFSINKISKNSNYNVSITENKGNIDPEHHQAVLQAMAFGIA